MSKQRDASKVIAVIIEVAIILTVVPRWVPALMRSEGFELPEAWLSWWVPLSAAFNAGMAVTEAVAIAYVFTAWQNASGREAKRLLSLTVAMLFMFVAVLSPFVAGSIAGVDIRDILANIWQYFVYLLWGAAVVLSTGITVMGVGLAQGVRANLSKMEIITPSAKLYCWCGDSFVDEGDLRAHQSVHEEEMSSLENPKDVLLELETKYQGRREQILPPIPSLVDITRVRARMRDSRKDLEVTHNVEE